MKRKERRKIKGAKEKRRKVGDATFLRKNFARRYFY